MATIETIVGRVRSMEGEAAPSESADGIDFNAPARFGVGDARDVVLSPTHPQAGVYRSILESFWPDQIVAFMEVDSETRELQTLAVPVTGAIAAVDQQPGGEVLLQLVGSSVILILKADEPGFDGLFATLQEAADSESIVAIRTKALSDEIADVAIVGPPKTQAQPEPEPEEPLFGDALLETLTPVADAVAQQLFDLLADRGCDRCVVNLRCIPFRFPDDGCLGRAHLMCHTLSTLSGTHPDLPNVTSGKIWRYGAPNTPFVVSTENSPACAVKWLFHCAPLIRLTDDSLRVLDPSLFDRPVTPEEWEHKQLEHGTRMVSDRTVFYRQRPDRPIFFDQHRDNAKQTVGAARGRLMLRVAADGCPPYVCPV